MKFNDAMDSKEEITRFIETEDLKYQSIDLPYGIKTPGDCRDEAVALLLSELKESHTVLDVGSFLGLFCLTSLQQGASTVTGLQLNRDRIRQAIRIADFLQLKPTYLRRDVEDYPELDNHDIVLCLNVLHHLKNPIGVLRYLALHTNETLIVEAAQFGRHDIKSLTKLWSKDSDSKTTDFRALANRFMSVFSRTSSAFIAPYAPKSMLRTYFFSKSALNTILASHIKMFSSVETKKSSFKDRYYIVCKKLKIKHLIIVSGTCSSGKSTFIENFLQSGRSAALGLDNQAFQVVGGTALRNKNLSETFAEQSHDSVILHYDILSVNRFGIHSYGRDTCLDILNCAQKVSVVLLAPKKDDLINQLVSAEGNPENQSTYYSRLLNNYRTQGWLREVNIEWIDFLGSSLNGAECIEFYDFNGSENKLVPAKNIDCMKQIVKERYPG